MPAVTTAALLCGAALVVMARREQAASMAWQSRVGGLAVVLALAAGALVGWIGNAAMATAIADLEAGDYAAAKRNAERASQWAPWAAEPWHLLGEVHLRRGEHVEAEAAFREATDRDPHNWALWAEVARASEGVRRRVALAQVARLNPWLPAGGQDP
jgi:Flp pilus assembly protein TadD